MFTALDCSRRLHLWMAVLAALVVSAPSPLRATNLAWNATTGNFIGSPTWSFDNGGAVDTTSNPFTHPGPGLGGENLVLIGNGGVVTLNSANQGPFMDNSLYELRVGTEAAEANLTSVGGPDLRGDGTLTVDNVSLLLFDTDAASTLDTGRLIVGGAAGISGTFNWNSTQVLNANGHLRIGQGGTGVFNQNGGTVRSGTTIGTGNKDMTVGNSGGDGTLNLNAGVMELGGNNDGAGLELRRTLQIGQNNATVGEFNLGDGVGAAGSAVFETWSQVNVGPNSGDGVLNIKSDGVLRINYADALGLSSILNVGPGGGAVGVINQQGGVLDMDGLLQMGNNTGDAQYNLTGSTGTVNVRAVTATSTSTFTFNLDAGGATKITVEGNTNTAGDVTAGNSVSLSNSLLNITGLSNWASSSPITLFDQLDPTASLGGSFGNLVQGQVVGQNASSQNFYLNLYGGDGNDIVLQSTLPASSTDGLVWNVGAANFGAGWASGNGSFGVGASGVDPFAGLQNLYLGKNGVATYDGTTNDSSGTTVKNIYVGTNRAAAVVAGTNGNGTLTVNGAENLTVNDSAANGVTGMAFIGEAGFTGTLNWNSTGTFDVQGQFRVGISGGTGVVTQTAGVIQGGTTGGGSKYLSVGEGAGSMGTYNLNAGSLYPDGLGAPPLTRHLRIGKDGGKGTLNVGDGVGAANSALMQSEDDFYVGDGAGGDGRLNVKSDGFVELKTNGASMQIGSGGGKGLVVQEGGRVAADFFITIGEGAGSIGEYRLSGGTLTAAVDGADVTRVGAAGGNGTLRISGTGSYSSVSNMVIAQSNNSGAVGLLEFTGSQASFSLGRLENHNGNNETIRWVADANGVTPMVIQNGTGTNRVQLQNTTEVAANTGGPGNLMGDGIALSLDLSALTTSQTLTLIDNRSGQANLGFFEAGTTGALYEEGESILGTGFNGTVSISYVGSAPTGTAGNDVVLNLVAAATNDADFDQDGDVDGADFLTWQRGLGTSPNATLAQGDATGNGTINGDDLTVWRNQFAVPSVPAAAAVPEPASWALALTTIGLAAWTTRRRTAA